MAQLFYDHLVIREDITAVLDVHDLDVETREELLQIIDETLHHAVFNVVLNHLPKAHHPEFISRFSTSPHDRSLLDFLQVHSGVDISSEISRQADRVKQEILSEIKKARRKK